MLLPTVFANGLEATYLTKLYAVLYSGLTTLINLPVAILTGIFKIIFPATSLLLMFVIPCPVNITLLILGLIPCVVISLLTKENISFVFFICSK